MLKQFRKLQPNEFILVGADTAAGGGDYCAVQFLSKTNVDVPMVYHSLNTATDMTNKLYPILEQIYDITRVKPVVAYERNNGGVFEMERLASLNRNGKFRIYEMKRPGFAEKREETLLGWDTNSASRPAMLEQLKEAVDKRLLKIYDKETVSELFSFITVKTSTIWKAQAEAHSHDDLVMALAIAWQLYQTEKPQTSHIDFQQRERFNQIVTKGENW